MGNQLGTIDRALRRGRSVALVALLAGTLLLGLPGAHAHAAAVTGSHAATGTGGAAESIAFSAGSGLAVSYLGPLGIVSVGNPVVNAQATAGAYGLHGATLQLAGAAADHPWDTSIYLFSCTLSASGTVDCPTSGLPVASYTATVSVSDASGAMADATGNFDVTCDGSAPPLSLTQTKAYWQSASDYQARMLSVDFYISNPSVNTVRQVTIISALNTNAVMLLNPLPSPSDIAAGTEFNFTLRYTVPVGIASFNTTVYATAKDTCGATFSYPAPYPGS